MHVPACWMDGGRQQEEKELKSCSHKKKSTTKKTKKLVCHFALKQPATEVLQMCFENSALRAVHHQHAVG